MPRPPVAVVTASAQVHARPAGILACPLAGARFEPAGDGRVRGVSLWRPGVGEQGASTGPGQSGGWRLRSQAPWTARAVTSREAALVVAAWAREGGLPAAPWRTRIGGSRTTRATSGPVANQRSR